MSKKRTLLETIRGGLFRCESFNSFKEIYKMGYIHTRDKKNPSKYERSYAQHIHKVALFDLKNTTDADLDLYSADWFRFFSIEFDPVAIAIRLDWGALESEISFFNNEIWEEARTLNKLLVPHIECWHPGPISLEHMTQIIVVCSVNPKAFKIILPDDDLLIKIKQTAGLYQNKYSKDFLVSALEDAHHRAKNSKRR
jgi:hypothetical protein